MGFKFLVAHFAFFLAASTAVAKSGVTYELNHGAGFIYQGDLWQTSLTLGYFASGSSSDNNTFSYKLALRRDLFEINSVPVNFGISFAQIRQGSMGYSANDLAYPLGIRYQLTSRLQLDMFVNLLSQEERFVYDSETKEKFLDGTRTGRRFLSSGGIAISLFF